VILLMTLRTLSTVGVGRARMSALYAGIRIVLMLSRISAHPLRGVGGSAQSYRRSTATLLIAHLYRESSILSNVVEARA
jgi:hypothetical protein